MGSESKSVSRNGNEPWKPMHEYQEGDVAIRQECIPVGCVPPTAVAVRGAISTRHSPPSRSRTPPPWSMHPPDQAPPGPGTPRDQTLREQAHPPVNRITDTCKNITFPQLRLRAVIMLRMSATYLYLRVVYILHLKI